MRLAVIIFFMVLAGQAVLARAQEQPAGTYSVELEAEAREVGKSLRCVVCQNQSIEDSAAPLAADMRQLVRERLAAGESPDQVRAFMTNRYGNFVLLRPPLQLDTLFLWFGPGLFILCAGACWWIYLRPQATRPEPAAPLTQDEVQRLRVHLLDDAAE